MKHYTLQAALDEAGPNKVENMSEEVLREHIRQASKQFKTSWVNLGQALYAVSRDKLFRSWGFEKFETYITKEVGIRKTTAIKLLRSYFYLEREEPRYLKDDYAQTTEAAVIPGYEQVDVLRLAKGKKDLPIQDYQNLKKAVFEKGRDALTVRKDLTTIMKQRKEVDPDEEREKRNEAAARRLLNALRSFKRDADVLKLLPGDIVRQATDLMKRIEQEVL